LCTSLHERTSSHARIKCISCEHLPFDMSSQILTSQFTGYSILLSEYCTTPISYLNLNWEVISKQSICKQLSASNRNCFSKRPIGHDHDSYENTAAHVAETTTSRSSSIGLQVNIQMLLTPHYHFQFATGLICTITKARPTLEKSTRCEKLSSISHKWHSVILPARATWKRKDKRSCTYKSCSRLALTQQKTPNHKHEVSAPTKHCRYL
jgi:hypothetical protein